MREPAIGVVRAARGADLNLLAGQLYFGKDAARVRTLLGSCVALTLWHPQRRIGGMCHFLLPGRKRDKVMGRDGRFGDEALELLFDGIVRAGTFPEEYEAHLYGGADTMPDHLGVKLKHRRAQHRAGLEPGRALRLPARRSRRRDDIPRNVAMNMADGQVDMRRGVPKTTVSRREAA